MEIKKRNLYVIIIAVVVFALITYLLIKNNDKNIFEYQGSFESVSGVKNILSCYCGNGGYINNNIKVCFDDIKETINCKDIFVKGYWKNKTINPELPHDCPPGTIEYLKVVSYKCI